MNFVIQLPPEIVRNQMIEAWVSGLIDSEADFTRYQELVRKVIEEGYSSHGINCFFMHESTQKFIKNKIILKRHTQFIEAALFHPICQN